MSTAAIETDYVYDQLNGGWYAQQTDFLHKKPGTDYFRTRVTTRLYSSEQECAAAVERGIGAWEPWNPVNL